MRVLSFCPQLAAAKRTSNPDPGTFTHPRRCGSASPVCTMRLIPSLLICVVYAFPASVSIRPNGHCYMLANAQTNTPLPRGKPLNGVIPSALSSFDSFFRMSPYTAAALICGVKASTADLIAHSRSCPEDGQAKKVDVKRNLSFILYGAAYQGIGLEFIYNHIYPHLFGVGTSAPVVLRKVCFDIFVQATTLTLPIAYITKALIYKTSPLQGLQNYLKDIQKQGLLTKYLCLWAYGPQSSASPSALFQNNTGSHL